MDTSDDIDDIRKELEEIRRLKESLKEELEELRKEKMDREDRPRYREHAHPREPHVVDLSGVTEGLDEMMEGLGEQIRTSLKSVGGVEGCIRAPQFRIVRMGREARRHIETIPPERVARAVSPLGSEERLKIIDILKEGGKSFNELETLTGKTGSSLMHHLVPLLEAGYVIKGEVRGTYYVTVEGRLAYRLAQWLTGRVEAQRSRAGVNGEGKVSVSFEDEGKQEDTEGDDQK
jgi:DNA-binding transcriptional ArsR family regulator